MTLLDALTRSIGKIAAVAVLAVVLLVGLSMVGSLVEYLDANQVMVVQSLGGNLTWYTDSGYHWQGFGKVTKYDRRRQYWFSAKTDQGQKADESITMRFNDGAHADLSGSIAWEIPLDPAALTKIYKAFPQNNARNQTRSRANRKRCPLSASLKSTAPSPDRK